MGAQSSRTASQSVVEALDKEGVEYVFGLTGTHVLPIFDALADKPHIRHITVKHESAAAYMASTYGFLTGRPGVALVTAGPGATNSLTGVAQAYAASHPMVHITGTVPIGSTNEPFHGVDRDDFLHPLFGDVTKWTTRIEQPEEIPEVLSKAFTLAASGRPGPVHVDIPENLLRSETPIDAPYHPSEARGIEPEAERLEELLRDLSQAERPMIVAGRGVLVHRAEQELALLAETISAPVLTTIYGDGALPDEHPMALGFFDEWWGNQLAWELMAESDFLLVLGMRSDTLMAKELGEHAPDQVCFVALDSPLTLQPVPWARATWISDIRLLLVELLTRESAISRNQDEGLISRIHRYKQGLERGREAYLEGYEVASPLHFGHVLRELSGHLAADAIALSGWGNNRFWGRLMLPVHGRDSFIGEASWGTMGFEVPGGVAAKLVHPDRPVVPITGDGALLMVLGDFLTAVENQANILVVVMNDSRYSNIWQLQKREFGRAYGDRIGPVNFAALAESMGGAGVRLERPEEIPTAVRQALELSSHSPVILDAVCDPQFGWPEPSEILALGEGMIPKERG
jgi:acetolactate synthase-1/2/3 large subunit